MCKIYTGFNSIDKNLNISKGDLVIVGGRPAIGKTSFICNIIKNTLDNQKGLFFSMQFIKSKAVESIKPTYNNNYEIVKNIVDIDEIILKTAENKVKNDISIVFIDNFIDLVAYSGYSAKRIILKLKEMAKRLDVAVFVTEHLVRNSKHYYTYHDIRHSDFISLADKILTINKFDVESNATSIRIEKDLTKYLGVEFRLKFDNNSFSYTEF